MDTIEPNDSPVDSLVPPDLRWGTACRLHSPTRRRRRRPDDPSWLPTLLALAETVYPSGRRCRGPRVPVPPELMRAFELYEGSGQVRWELEARLLAGQTDEEIAATTAMPAIVVGEYERTFFNVRQRLAGSDFILSSVIGYTPFRGFDEGDLRGLWAYYGYTAGPKMLELVMAVSLRRSLPQWALREAPSKADAELLEIGVRAMLLASTGAMTRHKLRKLRTLRAQKAELRQKSSTKALKTLVNATTLSKRESLHEITAEFLALAESPDEAVCDAAGPSSLEFEDVA
jgi:hypothetical protein